MGELVDDRYRGATGDEGVQVELLEDDAPVIHRPARDRFQARHEGLGLVPAVRLDYPQHDVDALGFRRPRFLKHRVGLPDARRHAEEDLEPGPRERAFGLAYARKELVGVGPFLIVHDGDNVRSPESGVQAGAPLSPPERGVLTRP